MSEHNYKEIWQEAMKQIHEQYKASGQEGEFQLWFNMEYIEDTFTTITVAVASEFMWNLMVKKGNVDKVAKKICQLTGLPNIQITYQIKATQEQNQNHVEKADTSKVVHHDPTPITPVSQPKAENHNHEQSTHLPKFSSLTKDDSKQEEVEQKKTEYPPAVNQPAVTQLQKHPQLREDYKFDTFVPGDNSNLAYNICLKAAKDPGKDYNPILIYGGVGLGKTHLMQSIGNYIYQQKGEKAKICCVSAETFTNEFIQTINNQSEKTKFKNKYRKLDVLLIDDIHFLQKKDGTQEELFYTFNELYDKHAQLVFTCDRPISELKNFEERLTTRLSRGISVDIQMPNYETRRAILTQKLEKRRKHLPDEVIDFIAKNVQTNVRDLEASLTKAIAYEELIGRDLNLEIAQELLRDIFKSPQSGTISIDIIQKIVAEHYNISLSDIRGKSKGRKVTMPRQLALYLARELTEYSWSDLGNEFGGRDHSTAMHAYNKIADARKTDSTLDSLIEMLKRTIKDYKK